MPNYSKSKIYKIVCNITGETYYGSTTQALSVRIGGHRIDAKKEANATKSKQIILRGNYDIVLCEEYPCENREQLYARERKWIEENDCINKNIPGRTRTEYREINKEQIKQYNEASKERIKQYREANREQIKQKKKQYYEANKERIRQHQKQYNEEYYKAKKEQIIQKQKEWYKANREQYKQYYESNKNHIKQYKKQYYESRKAAKTEELTYEQMINKMTELHKQCDEIIIRLDNLAK